MEKRTLGVVLLAAGNSQRYNGKKLLEPFAGKPMYQHMLEKIEAVFSVNKVIVTQYQVIAEEAEKKGFQVIINDNPQDGIAHSIHLGINYFKKTGNVDGILFSVCDQPFLKKKTLERLKNLFETTECKLFCTGLHGEMGNPCIIGQAFFDELMALKGDVGGKKVLLAHKSEVVLLEVEEEELMDIDTREEADYLQTLIHSEER